MKIYLTQKNISCFENKYNDNIENVKKSNKNRMSDTLDPWILPEKQPSKTYKALLCQSVFYGCIFIHTLFLVTKTHTNISIICKINVKKNLQFQMRLM